MMASMCSRRSLLTLAAAACALLPLATFAAESDIVAAEQAWARAVVARDFQALDEIYHDGLIYAHSTGSIETKSEYLGKLREGAARYDEIKHYQTTVRLHGKAAVAHSIVTMRGASATGPFDNRLMMIHFWVQEGKRWKLAAHQTTLLETGR
jgi:ketosteroid isomerase-like protein